MSRSACIAFFAKIFNLLAICRPEISDYEREVKYTPTSSDLRFTQFFAEFIKTIKRSEFVFLQKS